MAHNDVRIMAKAPPDPKSQTAAFKIFNNHWLCFVRQIDLVSKEYLEVGGVITSGIKEIDRTAMMAYVPCRPTIVQMAILVDEGAPIRLKDPNDAPKIYNTIRQHLVDHAKACEYDINKSKVPVDDLRKLDVLAEYVYPISRGMLLANGPEEHEFHRRLREFGGRGFISKLRPTVAQEMAAQQPATPYESGMPSITKALGQRDKPWLKK
jgi:hypothetical protein